MPDSTILVRPITAPADLDRFFLLSAQAFGPRGLADQFAEQWHRFVVGSPTYAPEQIWGAYRAGELLAGYTLFERPMNFHGVWLRTACVGAVVTDPAYRKQGAFRALMLDSIERAISQKCALMLLHGDPELYDRYGYTNIFDRTTCTIDYAAILAQPASPYSVRLAVEADAGTWLRLFQQHYGAQTGSFMRIEADQAYRLRFALSTQPQPDAQTLDQYSPVIVEDADGVPRGYLQFPWAPLSVFGCEAAADDWPAVLALLKYHTQQLATLTTPVLDVRWPLLPTSTLAYLIGDNIRFRATIDPGWMARPAHLLTLIETVMPVWQARWPKDAPQIISLDIGNESFVLAMSNNKLERVHPVIKSHDAIRLSVKVFMRLLFGYRSMAWAVAQPEQSIPTDKKPLLEALFPKGFASVPSSDSF